MKSDAERCAEYERFKNIDAAFRAGDLAALRAAVDEPDIVPNGPMPLTIGPCLAYAIYPSSLQFILSLLEIGADPNPEDHSGFPPLIAALSCSRPQPGSPARADVLEILKLLLSFKADPNQRGINDYTPLHMAVSERNYRRWGYYCKPGRIRGFGHKSMIMKRLGKRLKKQVFTNLHGFWKYRKLVWKSERMRFTSLRPT